MTAGTDKWGSGPMATALSNDGGATWRPGPKPADDGSTTGHGFIDIVADDVGILHLTWLDSRDGKQGLRYARSEDAGKTWAVNITAKAGTCECCSNAIVAGGGHTTSEPKQLGDASAIQGAVSADAGITWSNAKRLSSPDSTATHPRVVRTVGGFRSAALPFNITFHHEG